MQFEQSHFRRAHKIFKVMATFIGTRAADQCRSHHQKMEKKYGSFHGILTALRRLNYEDCSERISQEISNLELLPASLL
jgi:hypothetical protein